MTACTSRLISRGGTFFIMNDYVLNIFRVIASDQSFVFFLNRSKVISLKRGVYYGFEWLFHTTIASYFIENERQLGISNLSIGSVYEDNQKPDIKFCLGQDDILIELKTIEGNEFSWCKTDILKLRNYCGYKYVAACSYRKRKDTRPKLLGAQYVNQVIINDDFRIVLLSV